jgi:hypothetical protein
MTARKQQALCPVTLRAVAKNCMQSSRDHVAMAKQATDQLLALPKGKRGRSTLDYTERMHWAKAFAYGDLGRALRTTARNIERQRAKGGRAT